MADKKDKIEPIDATFDEVVSSVVPHAQGPATLKGNNFKYLGPVSADAPATPRQLPLDLGIEVEKRVDGIEMGILQNGISYLTQRGLAQMSGAARATIQEITQEWEDSLGEPIPPRGRMAFFKEYLFKQGYDDPRLFIEISKNGSPHYAYPEIVCMAFIEYFAFEAQRTNDTAASNFRKLARFGLQQFIYRALDYTPEDKWRYFNDRVSLLKGSAPDGYFILFSETTGLAVDLINADLTVNEKTLPDISVGIQWAKFWTEQGLDAQFGPRIKYEHNYPDYYPQSASNPQPAWAYPDEALPAFRRWFRHIYLPTKFPKYILSKANLLRGGKEEAAQIAALFDQKRLES